MYKGKLFEEGQKVKILPSIILEHMMYCGISDIVVTMIPYGGFETKIRKVIPQEQWTDKNVPEYFIEADTGDPWVWYHNLLEPID